MRNVYKMKPSGIRCLLSSVLAVVSMAITGTNVAEAQGLSVSGRVTDARGGEISGATVIVKGDNTRGTTTDAQGQYAIEVLSSDDVLVFSFLGYKTAEVAVRGRKIKTNSQVCTLSSLKLPKLTTVLSNFITACANIAWQANAAINSERKRFIIS